MALSFTKTALILAAGFFILAGCQGNNIAKPIKQTSDYVTGKVQIEQKKQVDKTLAAVKCQELCQNKITENGQDYSLGPCLSNGIIPDWVCDMAHSPRQAADNDPKNQCPAFVAGKANHFVEVDGNCNILKTY